MPPAAGVKSGTADVMAVDALSSLEGVKEDGDLYIKLKTLQRQLEFLDIQEEYIKVRG